MPRYQYECEACGDSFEQRQSFADDALTDCPLCNTEGSVQRLITQVGVVFKGSGFYINDSKKGNKKESKSQSKESESSSKVAESNGKSEKSDKPEAKSEKTEKKSS